MTTSQTNSPSGDKKAPSLAQSKSTLQASADLADQSTAAVDGPNKAVTAKGADNIGTTMAAQAIGRPPVGSCQQMLWFSFFFDGTGNNLDADKGTLEHSNVARLYRVHPVPDPVKGIYSIYVPGIGTYFKDVGDNGGTFHGLAFGTKGQARLDWALEQFDEKIKPHLARAANPTNGIIEINIAAFGFSRGATMARAFIRDFIVQRCNTVGSGLQLKQGNWPLRVRFMGLFDTVASVGLPMSANNLGVIRVDDKPRGNTARNDFMSNPPKLRAIDIAFGPPGADPAPGGYDGHANWADNIQIPAAVERAVHYIAAHEIRNSFPVDSVCRGGVKPNNCKEVVCPGVHSDLGGGYRPGEGGKSGAAESVYAKDGNPKSLPPDLMLSLIPLRHMYNEAIEAKIPLLPERAWRDFNKNDFRTSHILNDLYNYYMSKVGWGGRPIGQMINAHMALYYAWRFAHIHRKQKGDQTEKKRIEANEAEFDKDRKALDDEILSLERKEAEERRRLDLAIQQRAGYLQHQYGNPAAKEGVERYDDKVSDAREEHTNWQDRLLRANAKRETMPNEAASLLKSLDKYDAQLIADAGAIREVLRKTPSKRSVLRPHYRGLIEAYENEFFLDKGLKDEKIFAFVTFRH